MAINFPSTSGQATDGSFTHTVSGLTWVWDGVTWKAQGITGTYTLPTASSTILGGVKVGTNLSINGDGVLSAATGANVNCFSTIAISGQTDVVADSNSDTLTFVAGTGITLTTNATSDTITIDAAASSSYGDTDVNTHLNVGTAGANEVLSWDGADYAWVAAGGGGGSSLQSRTTAQGQTLNISVDAAADIEIACAKTYVLHKISTNVPAWVTVYTDANSRANDSTRSYTNDPLPGSGVIAEVITTENNPEQLLTPGVVGFNNDSPAGTDVYLKVVNKGTSVAQITVTLHYLQLEA